MTAKRIKIFRYLICAGIAGVLAAGFGVWTATTPTLELLKRRISVPPQAGEFVFLDSEKKPFDRQVAAIGYRPVKLAEVDANLNADLVQLEDRGFFSHSGVDALRTLRVTMERLFFFRYIFGTKVTGGSTITQQLVKNILGHAERSFWQKIQELFLAVRLEYFLAHRSGTATAEARLAAKKIILENYWNYLFVAHRLRGLGQLRSPLLGLSLSHLRVEDRLLILALVKSPANLGGGADEALAFLMRIYGQLVARGRIREAAPSAEALRAIWKKFVRLREKSAAHSGQIEPASSYARSLKNLFAVELASPAFSLQRNTILTPRITRLDNSMQKILETRLAALNRLLGENRGITGAYMLVRLKDAAVVAASEDRYSEFNELIQARRQVSSTIKPLLYAYAMEKLNLEPNAIFTDKRITVIGSDGKPYSPANHYKAFRGPMPLKTALQVSANTVSLQLYRKIDARDFRRRLVIAFSRKPGEKPEEAFHSDYSLALGTVDLAPSQVLSAYLALVGQGVKRYPVWGQVESGFPEESPVLLPAPHTSMQVFDPLRAEQVREMLTAVLTPEGTGGQYLAAESAFVIHELGAKSGSGALDSWFVGYSEELLLMVWLGFRRNVHKAREFHAATLWYDLFLETVPYFPPVAMRYMPGTERRYFCTATGAPANEGCRKISSALFRRN